MRCKGILILLLTFMLSACGTVHGETDKKIDSRSYFEKTIELKGKYNLNILCDTGNISIYTWTRNEIKFEVTKRFNGACKKDLIDKKLENIKIDINTDDNTVFLKGKNTGGNKDYCDVIVDYTIYMPKSVDYMNYKIGKGKVKLFDDFKGILNAELDNADIEINRFVGVLNVSGDEGNVKISSGKISGDSKIFKKVGNISIKSEFDLNGDYEICTGLGHIELLVPAGSKVNFETVGELAKNEFAQNGLLENVASSRYTQVYNLQNGNEAAKVRLRSEMGKISIGKY